ncbi:MAG: L,D-transpeptidase family protein [Rubricoccaceae bacterium]
MRCPPHRLPLIALAACALLAASPAAAQATTEALAAALPGVRAEAGAGLRADSTQRAAARRRAAADDPARAPAYYVVAQGALVREAPEASARVVARPAFRDAVRVLGYGGGGWARVQHGDVQGYLPEAALSNVWIRVSKSERMVYVYRGAELYRAYPADVSASDGDKVRRARIDEPEHHRIPEGVFFITRRHGRSQYYRAFVLNYPNHAHALRGLREGLITEAQYQAIARAEAEFREPPMNTPLGGLIEIHGDGSGRQRAWTRGCVALRNVHMDELWEFVEVGTPVLIER